MPRSMPKGNMPSRPKYAGAAFVDPDLRWQGCTMQNLRTIRKQRGLTQEQLAEMAGVNQATISKLERGSEHVTLGLICAVAAALDVPPALLLDMPETYQRCLNALARANEDTRKLAVTVIESMTKG